MESAIVRAGAIEERILLIRGERIIIDADLADFYGVPTKRLNEQVKRNRNRFPDDFVFQLNVIEKGELVAKCDHLAMLKYSSALPYAFSEHGALMAASVLKSDRAVEVSIYVVRAFIRLRQMIAEHRELAHRIAQFERHLAKHDSQILSLLQIVKDLIGPKEVPKERRIGFQPENT
jgi:hypothetical protein